MKLTGHKTEAVYRRYAIVSEADLHEAVSKLARLVHDAGTADASVGTRVRRKLAEGEGFEPPRASQPGGFQVLKLGGTIGHYRTPLATISASCSLLLDSLYPLMTDGGR